MDRQKLRAATEHATLFEDSGDPLKVEYRPAAVTAKVVQQLSNLEKNPDQDGVELVARSLEDMIAAWDMTDGKDEAGHPIPYPPTYDNLVTFPLSFLVEVFNGLVGTRRPNSSN